MIQTGRSLGSIAEADARRAAEEFCVLYDRAAGAPSPEEISAFREQNYRWDDATRFEFLVSVASHVASDLTQKYPDDFVRAGRLIATWFLR